MPSRVMAGWMPARWRRNGCGPESVHPAGFTIVEMLFVLILIGVLIGLARPLVDVAAYRMRATTHAVTTTLLAAQRLAVKRQHDVVIAFDVGHGHLRLHEDRDSDGQVDEGEPVRVVELGEGIEFGLGGALARSMGNGPVTFTREQDNMPAVAFHRNGSASEQGGFYLTSGRAAETGEYPEDTRAFEVERSTGRTTWFRYSESAWKRGF